jgi:cytolethal distending toxin subunit A
MNTFLKARRFIRMNLLAMGLLLALAPVHVSPAATNQGMLINVQTGKCLTIAGGRSTENNVNALQFTCDFDPSRRWRMKSVGGIFQI